MCFLFHSNLLLILGYLLIQIRYYVDYNDFNSVSNYYKYSWFIKINNTCTDSFYLKIFTVLDMEANVYKGHSMSSRHGTGSEEKRLNFSCDPPPRQKLIDK